MRRTLAAALLGLLGACASGPAPAERALDAMVSGDLDRAEAILRAPATPEELDLKARLLLLRNRNREAADLLAPLMTGKVQDVQAAEARLQVLPHLLSALVRQNDFAKAAPLARRMGDALLARKYETLGRSVAYAPAGSPEDETFVLFSMTHPAIVIPVAVHGRAALFLLDTTQDEIVLDRDFARKVGISTPDDEAVADQITVGRWTLRNIPVHIGRLPRIGAMEVSGALGLSFLMQHDFTIDLKRSRLTLRRGSSTSAAAPGAIPILRAGERHLLLPGTANGSAPVFVGLATSLQRVTVAASDFHLQRLGGRLASLSVGPLRLALPEPSAAAFPAGLDDSFGVPAAFVLGNEALRGRAIRIDPRSMRAWIE
jgi:hypothetical protein